MQNLRYIFALFDLLFFDWKNFPITGIQTFIFVFSMQLIVNKIADDWIRTMDLWGRKQPFCYLPYFC